MGSGEGGPEATQTPVQSSKETTALMRYPLPHARFFFQAYH